MFISEIFKSIQGEGVNAGKPAVFLRLSGCNFRCRWCDTKYAWEKGVNMSIAKVVERIVNVGKFKKLRKSKCRDENLRADKEGQVNKFNMGHVVVTGGEPLLQQEELKEVLGKLSDCFDNFYVELETNGSIECKNMDIFDLITCSPKLKGAGVNEYELKISPDGKEGKVFYKFVVDNDEDVGDAARYVEKWAIPPSKVILMPQGILKEQIFGREEKIKEICNRNGYLFSTRLQVIRGFR